MLGCVAGVRLRLVFAIPVAIVVPTLMHLAFYLLLRVPLPWGLLQPVVVTAA